MQECDSAEHPILTPPDKAYQNSDQCDPFERTLWCYVIIAIVVVIVGIILLIPNFTVTNALITVSWVVATLAVMIASLYTLSSSNGCWYYFAMVVTVLLVIFTLIWAGEYHNRGAHSSHSSHKSSSAQGQLWYTGITVIVIIGVMILLGCAIHSGENKSYSIPAAAVALVAWLIMALC